MGRGNLKDYKKKKKKIIKEIKRIFITKKINFGFYNKTQANNTLILQ